MKRPILRHAQQGATLVVGLIMLAVISLTVVTAFSLSGTNLKAVGNMQFRNEAIAAANFAIEQVLSTPLASVTGTDEINVDINRNGNYYTVQVSQPVCVRAQEIAGTATTGTASSSELDIPTVPTNYYSLWDIEAKVTDANTGTSMTVHQGIREKPSALACN